MCVDCIVDWREKRGSMMIYNRRSIVVRKTAPLLLKIVSSIIRSATRKIMLHQTIFKMWLTSSTILFPIFRHIIYNSASMRLRQIVCIKTFCKRLHIIWCQELQFSTLHFPFLQRLHILSRDLRTLWPWQGRMSPWTVRWERDGISILSDLWCHSNSSFILDIMCWVPMPTFT